MPACRETLLHIAEAYEYTMVLRWPSSCLERPTTGSILAADFPAFRAIFACITALLAPGSFYLRLLLLIDSR